MVVTRGVGSPCRALIAVLVLVMVGVGGPAAAQAPQSENDTVVEVTLFHMEGCPYCADERAFLDELRGELDHLVVHEYEISGDAGHRQLFSEMGEQYGFDARAVPVTIIGERYWVGFDDAIAAQIADAIAMRSTGAEVEPAPQPVIDVPGLGQVELGDRSLWVSTLLIGFVDGFNPCSLWVLSVLLALVLHSRSRRRLAAVGIVFLTITTALYGLYIVGVYSILSFVAYLTWIQRAVAGVAGVFGLINIKDYFWPDRGASLSITEERRPGLFRRMRALGRPEEPLGGVLTGTVALAIGVSLVETPCTAGLPILWTDLLAARDVSTTTAVALFCVYMAVFLVDELAVFAAAVVTMRAAKLQEQHGRILKLVAGVVMLALAITMIVDPGRLDSLWGTAVVFGSAGVVTLLVALVDRRIRRQRALT